MAKTSKGKEIIVVSTNKVGMLANISGIISKAGVNINAILARGQKRKAYLHFVVDRHMKAANALRKADFDVTLQDVILLEMTNKPGILQKITDKISAAGIDIHYIYGSAGGKRTSFCVIKTENDKKAMKLI